MAHRARTALLAVALLACSCGAPSPEAGRPDDPDSTRDSTRTVIGTGTLQPFPYTAVDSLSADLNGDGTAEKVRLLATVERDASGRFLWEDGHRWAAVVQDDANTYVLVEKFVPQGYLELFTILEDSLRRPVVLVRTSSGVGCGDVEGNLGVGFEKFFFDSSARAYVRESAVESSGVGACRSGAP